MTLKFSLRPTRRKAIAAIATAPLGLAGLRAWAQEVAGQPLLGNPDLPRPPLEQMRWAVVGLGTFAVAQVIPGFTQARNSRMTAFVSGNPQKAADLSASYGIERNYTYENFDAIADDPEIDCVYIALPVGLHAEYAIRALNAGKHVLCEKPMASTSTECETMIAAARANNRQLGVAYRVHFEPNNANVLQSIKSGEIGIMRMVSADHGFDINPAWPPHKWRLEKALAGGGSMFDIGIYGLNTSLMMLPDDRPVSVTASYSTPKGDARFAEVEGGIDWRMKMVSGINVAGTSSYCWSPYVARQRYFGSEGSIEMQPATTYYDNRILIEGNGAAREFTAGNPIQQFSAQVDGFSEAARANIPHRTPGEMGLRDIRIIEKMYLSADRGGLPVDL